MKNGIIIIITTGGGHDYISGPYSVTFDAQTTRASFDIAIINDRVLESNENFVVAINATLLPSNVTVGDHSNVRITIMDDEGKLIKIIYLNISLFINVPYVAFSSQ